MGTAYSNGLDALANPSSRRKLDDVIGAGGDGAESTSSMALVHVPNRGEAVLSPRPWLATTPSLAVDGTTSFGNALVEVAVLVVAIRTRVRLPRAEAMSACNRGPDALGARRPSANTKAMIERVTRALVSARALAAAELRPIGGVQTCRGHLERSVAG